MEKIIFLYFTKEIRPLWSSLEAVQGGCGQSIHSAIRAILFRLPCPLTVQSSTIHLFLGRWRYVETLLHCCECFLDFLDFWHYFPALLIEDRLKTVRPSGLLKAPMAKTSFWLKVRWELVRAYREPYANRTVSCFKTIHFIDFLNGKSFVGSDKTVPNSLRSFMLVG